MTKPIAWSYSALNAFETCPRQFYEVRVAKNYADEMGEAAKWGDYVHKCLDKRIGEGKRLPDALQIYEKYAQRFDNAPGTVYSERKIALTQDLEPVPFFDKRVWVRGIIDISVINKQRGAAWDWKSGKRKLDGRQLKLFAALMFALHPELEQVNTGYIWLKDSKMDKNMYLREHVPELWGTFTPAVARLERAHAENNWPPNPSGLCRKWCPVMSCEYNGRRNNNE